VQPLCAFVCFLFSAKTFRFFARARFAVVVIHRERSSAQNSHHQTNQQVKNMSTSGAPKQGVTKGSAVAEGYVAPPPEEGGPAVQTRAQQRGAPAPKPGALNPDAYYQEKDAGYGDVGVGQEKDAAQKDTEEEDPSFKPSS
jgi:hypothetical protein